MYPVGLLYDMDAICALGRAAVVVDVPYLPHAGWVVTSCSGIPAPIDIELCGGVVMFVSNMSQWLPGSRRFVISGPNRTTVLFCRVSESFRYGAY